MDGRTFETGFIRSTLSKSRPNNVLYIKTTSQKYHRVQSTNNYNDHWRAALNVAMWDLLTERQVPEAQQWNTLSTNWPHKVEQKNVPLLTTDIKGTTLILHKMLTNWFSNYFHSLQDSAVITTP